ncbi:TetR/AcrR family transcriptional regulator [Actinospica sp.]|uniref:TetR/AcrR family transcriptional regulator n=1 Tax=Actinospica sp. TaxID=1872142 RepID=UPI002C2249A5|nr:TetR family transcriptional regulator [Actinospica sp.]HWG23467.1 TetR family transcriptional regulator [Actinospica sp.]
MSSEKRPRRAPEPGERQRDAERSRQKILAAAVEEFGEKGFAGARVVSIAARAGLNQQLISYYFDGKQGLYDALRKQWLAEEARIAPDDVPYAQRLEGYLDTILENPARARLLLWQALDDQPDDQPDDENDTDTDTESVLEDIRRCQRDGELTSEYDAEFIMIVSWAAMMTPVALPQLVRGSYGADPAAFREAFLPQLQRLFRNAGPSSEPEA